MRSPRRKAILASAVAEFLRDGFHRASIEQIAAAAGVAKQTIYSHFSSKAGLIDAIDRECVVWPDHIADFGYKTGEPLRDQLTRIGRAILAVYADDAFIVVLRVRVGRWVEESDVSGPTVSSLSERFAASLKAWIEAAARAGRLSVDNSSRVADELLSMLGRPLWQVVLGGPPMADRELSDLLHSAVTVFLKAYETPSGVEGHDQGTSEPAPLIHPRHFLGGQKRP